MTFKTFLKNHPYSRKIFGKKELDIIFKQLDGIKLTQSEKNRLSRDIRPKLKFILDSFQYKDEFKLEKAQHIKSLIDEAKEVILSHKLKNQILAILLFGSYSNNTPTKKSDIDLVIIFKNPLSIKEATKFRIEIQSNLPEKIDIQVFNTLPQKVKRTIALNHKIIYKSKDFDDINFSINYLKNEDYFIRMKKIFGET